jgi:hypothetical protein
MMGIEGDDRDRRACQAVGIVVGCLGVLVAAGASWPFAEVREEICDERREGEEGGRRRNSRAWLELRAVAAATTVEL